MAKVILEKTKGTEYDLLVFDDDTIHLDGKLVHNAVVKKYPGDSMTVEINGKLYLDTRES